MFLLHDSETVSHQEPSIYDDIQTTGEEHTQARAIYMGLERGERICRQPRHRHETHEEKSPRQISNWQPCAARGAKLLRAPRHAAPRRHKLQPSLGSRLAPTSLVSRIAGGGTISPTLRRDGFGVRTIRREHVGNWEDCFWFFKL